MKSIISGYGPASHKAAQYIRDTYKIPDNEVISHIFEQEFNCKVRFKAIDDIDSPWLAPFQLEFETEEDSLVFLLRWS